jgi:hypothetical protein
VPPLDVIVFLPLLLSSLLAEEVDAVLLDELLFELLPDDEPPVLLLLELLPDDEPLLEELLLDVAPLATASSKMILSDAPEMFDGGVTVAITPIRGPAVGLEVKVDLIGPL